jgi:oxygen-independent coproporphyrinogen-3 oxidase
MSTSLPLVEPRPSAPIVQAEPGPATLRSEPLRRSYPSMLPYSVKVYPIVQTAPEVIAPARHEWLPEHASRGRQATAGGYNQLYLHVPFCPFLCSFCPLYKVPTPSSRNGAAKQQFLDAVTREIDLYASKPQVRSIPFHAVYFGGGTPTELTPPQLGKLLAHVRASFDVVPDAEITLEGVAAQMLAPDYLAECVQAGFNRISFGAQALDPEVRRLVGRGDAVSDYPALIELARKNFGALIVNLEIMAGQPGQSLESLERDVEQLIQWQSDSIDILYYVMMPGTKLDLNIRNNRRPSPAFGDTLMEMRRFVNERLPRAGYRQVTAEAFARSERDLFAETSFGGGSERGINTVLALGPSAFGLVDEHSYQNVCDLGAYLRALDQDRFPVQRTARLTPATERLRGLMLSLMRLEIPRVLIDDTWSLRRIARRWTDRGLVEPTATHYRLTEWGKLWYNHLQMDLLPMGDMAWALRMFGSISQQLEMMSTPTEQMRPFERALLSQLKSHGPAMFLLYKFYLLLHRLPFLDRRPIGFTGPVDAGSS